MSDGVIFILVFGGFFILRFVAATLVFFWILPQGDRCPNCDEVTVRMQPTGWNRLVPWLRSSWCFACGWDGLLRPGPLTPQASPAELTKKPL